MKSFFSCVLLAGTALAPTPALAQEASPDDRVAALAAEVARLNQPIAELEAAQAGAAPAAAPAASSGESAPATPSAAQAQAAAAPIAWEGAPEFESASGWSFKPFGRLNIDGGIVDAPDSTGREDGFGSEIRRARIGMEGDIPGGFGYKIEVDFAGNDVTVTDAIVTYEDGPLTLTAGQHNNFQSLEELTSSRWSSFIERAAFTDAFGFTRKLGVSAQVEVAESVLLQAGVFTDNIDDLPGDTWTADARLVASPTLGDTQLHFGGSVHFTDTAEDETQRYRQRPLVHFTSERFIDTGAFDADSTLGAGLEAAVITGPFHAVGEAFWQSANRSEIDRNMGAGTLEDAAFFGGYLEAGLFLTPGDSRGYSGAKFNRTRPARPVNEGGPGAWQVNVRYDYLDLTDSDAGITGGTQNGYFASLIWVPTDYTRLMLNYGRLAYDDAIYPTASGARDYSVDVLGVRAQIDF